MKLTTVLIAAPLAALLTTALAAAAIEAPSSSSAPPIHTFSSLVISPPGDRVASIENLQSLTSAEQLHGHVIVRSARDGRVLESIDPCATCNYGSLAWSSDGRSLAFIATDPAAGRARVMLTQGPAVKTLASLEGIANTPRFSPDGRTVAVLATAAAKKKTGALEAGVEQVGDIGAAPDEQRIAVMSIGGGELSFITPNDTFIYEYDWTPDGKGFVATAAKGDGDNNWWLADLEAFDLAKGVPRQIAPAQWAKYQMAMPRVSPDGKSVVFVGGIMSDFGPLGGEIYQVPFEGGNPVSLTAGFRGSFNALLWRGKQLFATAVIVDRAALVAVDPGKHATRTLWSDAVSANAAESSVTLSADGRAGAAVVEDFGHAPRIVAGPLPKMRTITHENDALTVDLDARSIEWKSDGFDVQGWLIGPAARAPGKQYPMIVHVHGGPAAAVLPLFGTDYSLYTTVHEWVVHGYYVFMPNPRGSFGQGDAFARANIRDFGGGDFRDIMSGVDAAEKVAPIDDRRLGIHGHSYGGFMVMWVVTHTNRFRTAIAGAGISDWISYYGLNGIDTWMLPYFGASMYDDPAAYRAVSPLESIKSAQTPTLLYTGEYDVEVPAEQSFEFWHALRDEGVTTDLHVYSGEGHLIQQSAHILDLRRRLPEWFDHYLAP